MFKCNGCGKLFNEPVIVCDRCGGLVRPVYDWSWGPRRGGGIWGFKGSIPFFSMRVSLGEAWTPLIPSNRIFRDGLVFFKDEGRNPTGSFRDRAAAVIVSHACSTGSGRLVVASDGNMGVSVSAYASRCGLPVRVLVPSSTDPEKILLMRAFGAEVEIRDEGIDDLVEESMKYSRRGYYNATSTLNTLSIEGLKTISYELYLDMVDPREIFIPLGSGLTLLSLYIGFKELVDHGYMKEIPSLVGVETCGNPYYASLLHRVKRCVEKPFPGLSYNRPVITGLVRKVLEEHGRVVVVNRRQIVGAAKMLSRMEGLFVEPSAAVSLAGALSEGVSSRSIILLTGHGLKGPWMYVRGSRLRETMVYPGRTKRLILKVLGDYGELSGYDVWRMLGLRISYQAVHQHLKDLEDQGLVSSRLLGNRRLYSLTDRGRKLLEGL